MTLKELQRIGGLTLGEARTQLLERMQAILRFSDLRA